MKYYSVPEDEGMVYNFEHFKAIAREEGRRLLVEGMKREIGGEMWCKVDCEFIESSECCGRQCTDYDPCNKVSGRCKELTQGFIGTGVKYKITEKGGIRRCI